MKLGYRDRVILLIACVIIIFCIGIFLFIKPKWEELSKNEKDLDDLQTKWNNTLNTFSTIPGRQKTILEKYEEGKELAAEFTPEMDAVGLDKFLQEKFMNTDVHIANGLEAKGAVSFTNQTPTTINYYYYTPNIVTYPLYEMADMDGSLKIAAAEKRKESDVLSKRTAQSVGSGKSQLLIHTTRQDLMNLLAAIHEYAVKNKDAMIINSVAISDYTFGLDPGYVLEIPEEIEKDEEGKIVPAEMKVVKSEATYVPEGASGNTTSSETDKDKEKDKKQDADPGYSDVTIQYDVYYMQEPMKPDVGAEYDASIWDGDEWRTYSAAGKAQ
jgi:predicted metallopeptidase